MLLKRGIELDSSWTSRPAQNWSDIDILKLIKYIKKIWYFSIDSSIIRELLHLSISFHVKSTIFSETIPKSFYLSFSCSRMFYCFLWLFLTAILMSSVLLKFSRSLSSQGCYWYLQSGIQYTVWPPVRRHAHVGEDKNWMWRVLVSSVLYLIPMFLWAELALRWRGSMTRHWSLSRRVCCDRARPMITTRGVCPEII